MGVTIELLKCFFNGCGHSTVTSMGVVIELLDTVSLMCVAKEILNFVHYSVRGDLYRKALSKIRG